MCFTASSNSFTYASINSGFLLYFSCTIFRLAPARLTAPFAAPQEGQILHRLHLSASFFDSARLGTISSRGLRKRFKYCWRSSSGSITRLHSLHTCCRMAIMFLK